ncbi:MAG: glycosyl hydrolase family 28-related protein [Deltaproteobacteria bacterium]|nr:glycosyl hydrolase family 28-related protein [Deltaproteobacteria bacterium]
MAKGRSAGICASLIMLVVSPGLAQCLPAASEKVLTVSVKESRFGAKGDGVTDDTAAIQKAVDWVFAQGGGKISFPPGTYIVTSVNIREGITYEGHGATIKRPDYLTDKIGRKAAHWIRTFSNQKYKYCGQTDSRPLIIRGLTFDGSSQTQGPYQKHELEHAALVFLTGDNKCPGRLNAIVEDCVFRNGVGDALHAYVNTKVIMKDCLAENVFRGGFTLTGGHSIATVKNLTTRGRIDPTGIDVEVDGAGYGNSYKVEVYLENLNLEDGDFDVGVRDGSLVEGKNIIAEAPFHLYTKQSSARFSNCRFGVAPENRIIYPYKVTFQGCEFFVSARTKRQDYEWHSAAPVIAWNLSGSKETNQKLVFANCTFSLDAAHQRHPGTKYYGLLTGWDAIDLQNFLEVTGGRIAGNFDVGVGTYKRGGHWRIRGLTIAAALPFSWTGVADNYGRSFCDILIDGVKINSSKYMHITGYGRPTENRLEQRNVVIPAKSNFLSSTYGLEGNRYEGGRVIEGERPPTPETHGLPGDVFRLKTGSGEWLCTKAGYYHERAKKTIPAVWQAR